jgi:hypothetical protein
VESALAAELALVVVVQVLVRERASAEQALAAELVLEVAAQVLVRERASAEQTWVPERASVIVV